MPDAPVAEVGQVSPEDLAFQQRYQFQRHWFWYFIIGGIVLLPLFYGYFGFKVTGGRKWRKGAQLIVANHRSNLDPFVVGVACPRIALTYMGKMELFRNPVLRTLLPRWGAFPFVRQITDVRGVRLLMEMLKRDQPVVLFPEGTRSRDGRVAPFHSGFVRIAARMNVPIMLVAIDGAERALPVGATFPRPWVGIKVTVDGPVHVAERLGKKATDAEVDALAEELRQRIIAMLAHQQ